METGRRLRIRKSPVEAEPSAKMEPMAFEAGQIVTYFSPKTFHPDSLQYATYYYKIVHRENTLSEREKVWLHIYTLQLIHPQSANVPHLVRAEQGEIAAVEAYQLRIAMERAEREYNMTIDALHEMLSVVEGAGYYEPSDEYDDTADEGYGRIAGESDRESSQVTDLRRTGFSPTGRDASNFTPQPSIYEMLQRTSDMLSHRRYRYPSLGGMVLADTEDRVVAHMLGDSEEERYRPTSLTNDEVITAADRMLDMLIASHTREPVPSATYTTPDNSDED